MTALPVIDLPLPWIELIERAEPDLLRAMLSTFVPLVMGAATSWSKSQRALGRRPLPRGCDQGPGSTSSLPEKGRR